jgi:hypothetical protein
MTIIEWLQMGIEKGWISEPFCNTHDGGPITEEEDKEWDEGYDPCATHVRVWGDI